MSIYPKRQDNKRGEKYIKKKKQQIFEAILELKNIYIFLSIFKIIIFV